MSANLRCILLITSIFLFSSKAMAANYFSCTFSEYVTQEMSPMGQLLVKEQTESVALNTVTRGFVIDLTSNPNKSKRSKSSRSTVVRGVIGTNYLRFSVDQVDSPFNLRVIENVAEEKEYINENSKAPFQINPITLNAIGDTLEVSCVNELE